MNPECTEVTLSVSAAEDRLNRSLLSSGIGSADGRHRAPSGALSKARSGHAWRSTRRVGLTSRTDSVTIHRSDLGFGLVLLAECLVGPEADDGQPQRVHGQLVVLHVLAEDIGHAGDPSLPLEFGMIRRVRVHLLELDPRGIGRLPQVVQNNVLDLDIDIRKRAVAPVRLNDLVLLLLGNHGPLHIAIEEIERVRLIALDGEAVAAEIEFGPAREVILVLGLLRAVLKVAIVDGFGSANVVDTDDERVHIGKGTAGS